MKPRIGLLVVVAACAPFSSGPGRAEAGAISYNLQDLGTTPDGVDGVYVNNAQPWARNFLAPQVDGSGAVHYAATGATTAGGYSIQPANSAGDLQYTGPGSASVSLYVTPTNQGGPPILGVQNYAGAINDSGTAVGFTRGAASAGTAGFEYRPGGPTGLNQQVGGLTLVPGVVPGTFAWFALGVNAGGMIVGQAPDSTKAVLPWAGDFITGGNGRAFISDGATTQDLNTLIAPGSGFLLTSATSINDRGQIAGFGYDVNDGLSHAYLLTPTTTTPEPGAWALGVAGLGYLALFRTGRR